MTEYEVIHGFDEINKEVNLMMKNGWKPHGSLQVVITNGNHRILYQAMTR